MIRGWRRQRLDVLRRGPNQHTPQTRTRISTRPLCCPTFLRFKARRPTSPVRRRCVPPAVAFLPAGEGKEHRVVELDIRRIEHLDHGVIRRGVRVFPEQANRDGVGPMRETKERWKGRCVPQRPTSFLQGIPPYRPMFSAGQPNLFGPHAGEAAMVEAFGITAGSSGRVRSRG